MLAAEFFEQGIGPAEVARRLGVTTGAASQWKKAWQQGGKEALRSVPHPGGIPKLRSERLPDYHRLDLRVQYSRSFEHVDASFYLDLINAYARDNVFGWDYNQDYTEREASTGMPFVPSIGVRVVF